MILQTSSNTTKLPFCYILLSETIGNLFLHSKFLFSQLHVEGGGGGKILEDFPCIIDFNSDQVIDAIQDVEEKLAYTKKRTSLCSYSSHIAVLLCFSALKQDKLSEFHNHLNIGAVRYSLLH